MPLKPITMSTPQFVDLRPEMLIQVTQPQFPDRTPQAQAAEHQDAVEAARAAEQAQAVQPPPQPVYIAPALPTDFYKAFIYQHESGNNPGAINPYSGACGLGQALPCSKMGCSLSDYACQDNFFTQYAMARYGSWYNAYTFWIANSWW